MKHPGYFKQVWRHLFWLFLDHPVRIISVSVMWFILSLPLLYTFPVFLYLRIVHPLPYLILTVLVFYSPVSFGAGAYIMHLIGQTVEAPKFLLPGRVISMDLIRFTLFFKGITGHLLKSLLAVFLSCLAVLFLYLNFYFYWRVVLPRIPLLGIVLSGFIIWVALLFLLMNLYLMPILLSRKTGVFKAFYQAFLLVIDNIFYSIGVALFVFSFFVIMGLTLLGLFLVFFSLFLAVQFYSYFIIYQKYDGSIRIVEEKRMLRDIFRQPK